MPIPGSMTDSSLLASPAEVAAAAGATDLFVLRRISEGRFAHVGGVGRGGGWAGIVEVLEEELAPAALEITVSEATEPTHIFGPYWARWALTIKLTDDVFVVFGGEPPLERLADDEYLSLARYAADGLVEVAAAKRLADELEVLTAVQGLLRQPPESTPELLAHVVEHATRALSCELGVAYLDERDLSAVCDLRGDSVLEHVDVVDAAQEVLRRGRFPSCVQRASVEDLPAPFSSADGIHSYYLIELKTSPRGILVLMHTDSAPPRGFTSLCQTLGLQVADAGRLLLEASLLRDRMQQNLVRAEAEARRDTLTGLANRLAWEEACVEVKRDVPAAIVIVDGARLKAINETFGHDQGDRVLCRIAEVLKSCVRGDDVVARLGGDEFAILLREPEVAEAVVARIRATIAGSRLPDGTAIEVACGWTIESGGDLVAAQRRADAAMLTEKRDRRAA
jgi:diguanylate cyclase (GGDEF)-like protein